jgi:membrane protein YqaA with SNARE-associated domain
VPVPDSTSFARAEPAACTILAPSRGVEGLLSWFLSPWGLLLLSALDASPLVFLPFANDVVVIFLAARTPRDFWLYPLLATLGSLVGTAVSYYAGVWIGEEGLERWVSKKRFDDLKQRFNESGAVALGAAGIFPPPFPFTPFVLASGAFEVSRTAFFLTVAAVRMLRFAVEAWLAQHYGRGIVSWMESQTFRAVIWGFVAIVVVGTGYSIYRIVRNKPSRGRRPAHR